MLINLLIVDDRREVADQIAKSAQWSENGIVPQTAYNGQEALKIILQGDIHIVVTDIEMPFLSGLQLAEECKKRRLSTKIIVLSGYDNFSYAKQALTLGICEYLLKPVSMDSLLQAVLKVREQLREEQWALQDECRQHRQAMHSIPVLKNALFEELMGDNADWDKLRENAELANLKIKIDSICMVLLEPLWMPSDRMNRRTQQAFRYGLSNMAKEIFEEEFVCDVFETPKGMLAVVLSYLPSEKPVVIQYNAYRLAAELQKVVNQYYDMDLILSISSCCRGRSAFKTAYQECIQLLSSGLHEAKNAILVKSDDLPMSEPAYPQDLAEEILRAFSLNDLEKTLEKTQQLCNELLKVRRLPPVELKNKLCNLLIKLGYAKGLESNIFELSSEFLELSTMEEVEQWMCDHICQMSSSQEEGQDTKNKIEMVEAYIKEHYAQPISLRGLSESLYISESYLSILFKEQIGMNFTQYLTNLRMEKAKELLKSKKYKIYEIAQLVGYADTRYFSDTFRKNVGMLPKQWTKQLEKQSEE